MTRIATAARISEQTRDIDHGDTEDSNSTAFVANPRQPAKALRCAVRSGLRVSGVERLLYPGLECAPSISPHRTRRRPRRPKNVSMPLLTPPLECPCRCELNVASLAPYDPKDRAGLNTTLLGAPSRHRAQVSFFKIQKLTFLLNIIVRYGQRHYCQETH